MPLVESNLIHYWKIAFHNVEYTQSFKILLYNKSELCAQNIECHSLHKTPVIYLTSPTDLELKLGHGTNPPKVQG